MGGSESAQGKMEAGLLPDMELTGVRVLFSLASPENNHEGPCICVGK